MNKEAIKALYNFCVDKLNSKPIKTEKGTGYVIYTIATAAQINELTTLVESVKPDWIVKEFDEDWDRGKKRRTPLSISAKLRIVVLVKTSS